MEVVSETPGGPIEKRCREYCFQGILRLRPNDSFVANAARTDLCGKTPCLNWKNQKTQSPKNECNTMSTETEHGTITNHNLQKMHAGPYPQKKDVDSIALDAYLYPLEAPTRERGCTNSILESHGTV